MLWRLKDEFYKKEWENKEDPHCKVCIKKLRETANTVALDLPLRWHEHVWNHHQHHVTCFGLILKLLLLC